MKDVAVKHGTNWWLAEQEDVDRGFFVEGLLGPFTSKAKATRFLRETTPTEAEVNEAVMVEFNRRVAESGYKPYMGAKMPTEATTTKRARPRYITEIDLWDSERAARKAVP